MKALVVVASKHGSTEQIGDLIAHELTANGVQTQVVHPQDVTSLDGYDAVIVGGAVYADHWMSSLHSFIDAFPAALQARPTYVFASGPVGTPPEDWVVPDDVAERAQQIGARQVRVFAGRVDPAELGAVERAVVRMSGTQPGDYRDQELIVQWAGQVAQDLLAMQA